MRARFPIWPVLAALALSACGSGGSPSSGSTPSSSSSVSAAGSQPLIVVAEDLARTDLATLHHLDGLPDGGRRQFVASLQQRHQLLEQPAHLLRLVVGPRDGDLVSPHDDLGTEGRLDELEKLVWEALARVNRTGSS